MYYVVTLAWVGCAAETPLVAALFGDDNAFRRDGLSVDRAGLPMLGLAVLRDLQQEFVNNGGQVWLCGACTKPRGIGEENVEKGATIVGAAKVVEQVVAGARTVAFA